MVASRAEQKAGLLAYLMAALLVQLAAAVSVGQMASSRAACWAEQ